MQVITARCGVIRRLSIDVFVIRHGCNSVARSIYR